MLSEDFDNVLYIEGGYLSMLPYVENLETNSTNILVFIEDNDNEGKLNVG